MRLPSILLLAISSQHMLEEIFPLFIIGVASFLILFPCMLLLYGIFLSIGSLANIIRKKQPFLLPIHENIFLRLAGVALFLSLLACLYYIVFIVEPWTS
jgi:hypothetical protein